MQLPQPTWLHVAIPVLPVGEMPAIEEGRACEAELHGGLDVACRIHAGVLDEGREVLTCGLKQGAVLGARYLRDRALLEDRKSTRLNSSHVSISYAVFCLKKKTTVRETT